MADIVKGLPLGGSAQARFSTAQNVTLTTRQRLINIIPVTYVEDLSGNKFIKLLSRPGFNSFIVAPIATYVITRAMIWTGVPAATLAANGVLAYAEHNGTDVRLYKWDASATLLGTYAAAYECIAMQETLVSGVANLTLNIRLIASAYTQKALFFPTGGALTEITDGDFPTDTIGPFTHMDGFAFIMGANGNLSNSDVNSLSAWTANSYIATAAAPGAGVGVYKTKNLIVGIRTNSIDFYENAGNATGSPLNRIPQAAILLGALHSAAVKQVGDDIYFVGRATPGKFGVYQLSGFTEKKISTPFIDAALRTLLTGNVSETVTRGGSYAIFQNGSNMLGAASMHGQTVIFLSIGLYGSGGSLPPVIYAYIVEEDLWTEFLFGDIGNTTIPITILGAGASTFAVLPVEGISAAFTTTANDLATDMTGASGTAVFNWKIITHPISHGTGRRKFCKSLRCFGARALTAATIQVQYSDDDGANFSAVRTFDMSTDTPMLTRLGSYRSRIWIIFQSSSSGACDIDRVEETFEVGSV